MGNQQPSISEPIAFLARNAVLGDGYLWRHPECKHFKAIWTSTTPDLLQVKYSICPSIFSTGVRATTVGEGRGRYKNAKPLYRLASVVHPSFTAYKQRPKEELYAELAVEDFALWYLDDGCCVRRNDSNSHRFTLSIGDCASTPERRALFECALARLFGGNFGRVYKNNSRATQNNLVWIMTKGAAYVIHDVARCWGIMPNKFPR